MAFQARERFGSRIQVHGKLIGAVFRTEPDPENKLDSGWVILNGKESPEEFNDPEEMMFISLGAVLNKDDSFVSLLESAPGSRFVRLEAGEPFEAVGNTRTFKPS
ncbi:DUF2185 domain-containing protein [Methylobacillus sp. Pita2]|uniref:immunity protein Imm33 domain-containing protein n=1 Tax=Methylobacillus sp. Pita2 TaxID=3383245 RepID=UPI0038B487FA